MNELWFKIQYLPYLQERKIDLTAREGRRDAFHPKGYKIGERVLARCFEEPGIDEWQGYVIITDLIFKRISDLKRSDLLGGPADSLSRDSVRKTMASLYRRDFLIDEVITLVRFKYIV